MQSRSIILKSPVNKPACPMCEGRVSRVRRNLLDRLRVLSCRDGTCYRDPC